MRSCRLRYGVNVSRPTAYFTTSAGIVLIGTASLASHRRAWSA